MTGKILNAVLNELQQQEAAAAERIAHARAGWDSQDWDHVVEANEAAQDMAAELNRAVNCGGGAVDPQRLRQLAAKAESVAAELRAICARYR